MQGAALYGRNPDGVDVPVKVDASGNLVSAATDAAANAVLGATNDAAVTTNANGTISAKLRGIVALFVTLNALVTSLLASFSSVTPTHTAVNATTSTSQILASNANRKYALLINDSDTVVYIKIGAAAALNEGIRLNANGGSYEMSLGMGNLATGAINAIHGGTGNKALLITEGV